MVRHKVRSRFQTAGDLRWVSHHDLMRCFERMLRRAGLPFASTEGFNPHPRLVFAQSLALGTVRRDEVAELELTEDLAAEEVGESLAVHAPPGLDILSVLRIDRKATRQVRLALYRGPRPPDAPADLPGRIDHLMAAAECWVERTRPRPRRLNIRPYVSALRLLPGVLEMDLTVTPTGSARPEEVVSGLGLAGWPDDGAVVERIRLFLHDEPALENIATPCLHPAEEGPTVKGTS